MGAGQVIVQTVLVLPDLDLHVGYLLRVLWLLSVHLEIDESRACLKYQYISLWNRYFHTTDWYLLVQYVQVFQKWNIVFLVFEVKPSMDMKFIIKTKIIVLRIYENLSLYIITRLCCMHYTLLCPSHTYPVEVVTVGDCNLCQKLEGKNWFHFSHLDYLIPYQHCIRTFFYQNKMKQ